MFAHIPGQALQELSKEKSSQKAVENNTQQFLKSLGIVESKLSEQLNYLTQVSTGQPHEGSGYASAKVLQMAWHRIQHARSRVRELEDSRMKYRQAAVLQQNRAAASIAPGTAGASSTTNGTVATTNGNPNVTTENPSDTSATAPSTSQASYPPY